MFIDLLGKYQVKYLNIDELLKLLVGITMYDISRPIGKKQFQFHGIHVWTIHDTPELSHFYGDIKCLKL